MIELAAASKMGIDKPIICAQLTEAQKDRAKRRARERASRIKRETLPRETCETERKKKTNPIKMEINEQKKIPRLHTRLRGRGN